MPPQYMPYRKFPNIKILVNEGPAGVSFFMAASTALDMIASKPMGNVLLESIHLCDEVANPNGQWVVLVVPVQQLTYTHTYVRRHFWQRKRLVVTRSRNAPFVGQTQNPEGNLALRAGPDAENQATGGMGTCTRVKYNPNETWSPDGERPPFIGLAHELVHALRNAWGVAERDRMTEERQTVGLEDSGGLPTENDIRGEHNVPLRTRYTA